MEKITNPNSNIIALKWDFFFPTPIHKGASIIPPRCLSVFISVVEMFLVVVVVTVVGVVVVVVSVIVFAIFIDPQKLP